MDVSDEKNQFENDHEDVIVKMNESDEVDEMKKKPPQSDESLIKNESFRTPEHQPTHLSDELSPMNSPMKKILTDDEKTPFELSKKSHLTHDDELKALSSEILLKSDPSDSQQKIQSKETVVDEMAEIPTDQASAVDQAEASILDEDSDIKTEEIMEKSSSEENIFSNKNSKTRAMKRKQDKALETKNDEDNEDDETKTQISLVVTGKRQRQSVHRLQLTSLPSSSQKGPKSVSVGFYNGTGTPLGEIASINDGIGFAKTNRDMAHLHALHRLIYGRPGSKFEFRKNLRQFAGFNFEIDSEEYNQKVTKAQRMSELVWLSKFLHLHQPLQSAEQRAKAIINYLNKPEQMKYKRVSGIQGRVKRRRRVLSLAKQKITKLKKPKKIYETHTDENNDDSESEQDENLHQETTPMKSKRRRVKTPEQNEKNDFAEIKESDEENNGELQLKRRKLKSISPKKTTSLKRSPSKSPCKKMALKSPKKKQNHISFLDDLVELTKSIVASSNMETTTMKEILHRVAEHYTDTEPNILLNNEYKTVIKATVKELIMKTD